MESTSVNRSKQFTSSPDHNTDLPPSRRSHGSQADEYFADNAHGRRRSSVGTVTVTPIINIKPNTPTRRSKVDAPIVKAITTSQVIFKPGESIHYANILNEYIANGGDENIVPASFAEAHQQNHKVNKNNNGIGTSSTSISKSNIKSRRASAPNAMLIQPTTTTKKTRRDSNPISRTHRSSSTDFHRPLIHSTDFDFHKSSASMNVNNMINGVYSVDHLNKSNITSPRSPRKSNLSRGKTPPMTRTSSSSGYFNPKPAGIMKSSSLTSTSRDGMALKLKPMLSESLDDYINKREFRASTSTASSFASLNSSQSRKMGSTNTMRRSRNKSAPVKSSFVSHDQVSAMAFEMTNVGDDGNKGNMSSSIWVGLEKMLKIKRK
ncbi:hypothetical protein HDU76_004390 [Blyttiomyces sp. JEL0837]|nr:hypothetical protein HDU76_004390 [Blyttiomyces sp. JEL0837]